MVIVLILVLPLFILITSYYSNTAQICSDEFMTTQPQGSLLPCEGEDLVENRGFLYYYNENDGLIVTNFLLGYMFLILPSALVVILGRFIINKLGNKSEFS